MSHTEYRYKNRWRLAMAFWTCVMAVWLGLSLWAYFTRLDPDLRGHVLAIAFFLLLPLGMTLLGSYALGLTFGTVRVDEEELELRSPFGTTRRRFQELDRVEVSRMTRDGLVLYPFEGAPLTVVLDGLENPDALRQFIKSKVVTRPSEVEGREFRPPDQGATFIALATIAALFAVSPWVMPAPRPVGIAVHLTFDAIALLFLVAAVHLGTERVRVMPERVVRRSRIRTRSVRFADVRQVILDGVQTNTGNSETLRLVTNDRDFVVSSGYERFPQLRDALISRCTAAEVKDKRPPHLR